MAEDFYLMSDPRVRFDARPDDILVAGPEASRAATEANAGDVRRLYELCDGTRTFAAVLAALDLEIDDARALVDERFGTTLFAPHAVIELERRIPSSEIVRFPGSPYEIVRNYWGNMAAVRERLGALFDLADRPADALLELCRLHRVALLGADETSEYLPASPVAKKGIEAGALFHRATRIEDTPTGAVITEGPRVNAALLGEVRYWALLAEELGDAEALEARSQEEAGLAWGRVVIARARDEQPKPWFVPPRPLTPAHGARLFEALARARDAARAKNADEAVRALADFHQKFVRLHPFQAGNQSLAMNIVNSLLAELGGAGIPHLTLDHFALRFDPGAYARLFARAVQSWSVPGTPVARFRALTERKQRYFTLVGRLSATADDQAARAIVAGAPADAPLALFGD